MYGLNMTRNEQETSKVMTLPRGTPDQLDEWLEDQDRNDYLETIFDPDGPFIIEYVTWK